MRHATNLPQNPKKGTLLWHWGRAQGCRNLENISRWFKFFKGSLDGYFAIKKKCLKCFNTKIMYKMFLKICKSGHLKIFKSTQLRLMPPPPVSPPGISACLRNGLHEESIICPRKHFKSNEGLILIIYQHI